MTINLKNYQFVCKGNIFRHKYITVYGVESYEIAKNMIIEKIAGVWWGVEMKRKQISELDKDYNSEGNSEIRNGTMDFPE